MIALRKPSPLRDRTRDLMVHIQCTGCGNAICAAKLKGIRPNRDVDCHVCAELEHRACPHCGLS
jgi:ribose 5-phosphate isomerase RpiB